MKGDETQVRQIFLNILNNSVKYTSTGYVALTVDWEIEQGRADISVSVEDSGFGIPEENLENLFDSFQRADLIRNRTIEGTGLGLAITKKLIEGMDGDIKVQSIYGEGTVFYFHILQEIGSYEPVGNIDDYGVIDDDESDSFIAPEAKVLAVDDNSTNRKVIKGILGMYQIEADTAASGEECLKLIQSKKYNLIFMDQMMPIMDGIETTAKISNLPDKELKNIPIIALTANAVKGSKEMFLSKGFQDYISKPMDMSVLERILIRYIPKEYITYVDRNNPNVTLGEAITIPDVDVDRGMSNYGNSRNQYVQMLKFIFDDGPTQMMRMKRQIEDARIGDYAFEVHALKGLMDGIGADKLRDMAKAQETAANAGDEATVIENADALFRDYEMLIANIKYVLTEKGIPLSDVIEITKKSLSEEDFRSKLTAISLSLDMLEQNKAETRIKEVLETEMDIAVRSELEVARREIKEFEYENAKKHIIKILGEYDD
ncbi:MAG: ATP-binding protein [Lachnospiraceae bacterium]|nr:ATP-binding protein [Lachnospiraceae bacterium]